MQRQVSEKLVLILPGLLLVAGLAVVLARFSDSEDSLAAPTFTHYARAASSPAPESTERNPARVADLVDDANTARPFDTAEMPTDVVDDLLAQPPAEVAYQVTIVDEEGLPVPHAKIQIIEHSRLLVDNARQSTALLGELGRRSETTDEDGSYAFKESRDHRIDIEVKVPGYATKRYRLRKPGKKVIKLLRNASLLGRVYGPDNAPVAGVEVRMYHDSARMSVVRTDEQGAYRFDSVTPTCATLRIHHPRYRMAVEHRIRMDGRIAYYQDFYLTEGSRLRARVIDTDGETAARATVVLKELESGLTCGTLLTDARGEAEFTCLDDDMTYLVEAANGRTAIARKLVAKTAEGNAESIELQLLSARVLVGVVRDSGDADLPVGKVQVTLESEMTTTSAEKHQVTVMTDENGVFTAAGLDPTLNYTAFLYHQDYAIAVVENLKPEGLDSPAATENPEPMPFTLSAPSRFDGIAVASDGSKLTRAFVTLDNLDVDARVTGYRLSVRPDENGRYSFTNLADGNYRLKVMDLRTGDSNSLRVLVDDGLVVAPAVSQSPLAGPLTISLTR